MLKTYNRPNVTIVINVGENQFSSSHVDLSVDRAQSIPAVVQSILELLHKKVILDPEYNI